MVQSKAGTVAEYLKELPAERRAVIAVVRKAIRASLPKGYQETMRFGAISYEIPLKRFPDTYNGQPLCYAGLAAQKHHFAVYLMCVYMNAERTKWLRDEFQKAGKKLDMGKSCIRFKKLEDLPLAVIGQAIASVPPERYIAVYEASRKR